MRTEDKHAAIGIRAHVHQLDKLRTLPRTTVSYSGVREFPVNPDAAPGRYASGLHPVARPDDFAAGELVASLYTDRHGDPRLWDRVDSAKAADEFAAENLEHIRRLHQLADDGNPHHGLIL